MKTPVHAPRARFTFHVSVSRRIAYVFHILVSARSTRVFDSLSTRRTATGSELFSSLVCLHTTIFILLSIFSIGETISLKIRERPLSWRAKCLVPVSVRGSKTSLALSSLSSISARRHVLCNRFVSVGHAGDFLVFLFFFFFARSARAFDLFPLHAPHVRHFLSLCPRPLLLRSQL